MHNLINFKRYFYMKLFLFAFMVNFNLAGNISNHIWFDCV